MNRPQALRGDGSARKHSSESYEHYSPPDVVEAARAALGGSIELDPASSNLANRTVRAERIFTIEDDALFKPWNARSLWLNPPGGLLDREGRRVIRAKQELVDGRKVKVPGCTETGACGLPPGHEHHGVQSSAVRWWFSLAAAFKRREVRAAVFLGFSLELLQTTLADGADPTDGRLPTPHDFSICWPRKRFSFRQPREDGTLAEGGSPPGGSFVVGLFYSRPAEEFAEAFASIGKVVLR